MQQFIITILILIVPSIAGIALIFRCVGTLLLNIGCGLLTETVPFQPERSLSQGGLGLLLLCSVVFLRSQLRF